MSGASRASPSRRELDLDQELILIRRFEDAVASLSERHGVTARTPGVRATSRIATNMRGHIR